MDESYVIHSGFNEMPIFSYSRSYYNFLTFSISVLSLEASRGAGAQSVTVNATGRGFDSHSRK